MNLPVQRLDTQIERAFKAHKSRNIRPSFIRTLAAPVGR